MLKKTMPLLALIILFLFCMNISALPTVTSVTMCKYIQASEDSEDVICQNIIDPPQVGTLSKEAYFDVILSGVGDSDIIVINLYDANEVLQQQDDYTLEKLINNHLIYPVGVSNIGLDKAGTWRIIIHSVDSDQDLVILDSFEFAIEYEETRPCNQLEGEYHCCSSPLVCPKGNRIEEGTCTSGTCCDAQENCQEPISGKIKRQTISCEAAGLQNCEKVVGSLYNYNIHGPLDKSIEIELTVRGREINCFDKTDIAIGYYDETNNVWIELASYVTEVTDGIYKVSALIDYLGYIGVVKTADCVKVSCTAAGGYQFEPTSGWVDIDETLKFKICGLVPGCDATRDKKCNENCPGKMDPDCKQTSCANTNDGCCLISKDDVCDPDCDKTADPDCCDKSKPGCCPGDIIRSGVQGCDKNCGLADFACSALENGCTSETDNCCHPANDETCDTDCSTKPNGGNADPNCGDKTSNAGDSCNPVTDGICDTDCVFGTDPDCIGGYVPYCGNGIRDSGETCECVEEGCGPDCTYTCSGSGWHGLGSKVTECAADVGTCYGYCYCSSGGW